MDCDPDRFPAHAWISMAFSTMSIASSCNLSDPPTLETPVEALRDHAGDSPVYNALLPTDLRIVPGPASASTFLRQFPELRILHECVIAIESGENQAGHTVKETGPLHIHLEARAERMGDQLMGRKSAALLRHATGHQIRVAILFRHIVIDVSKRILQRGTLKKRDRPIAVETFMNQFITIPKAAPSKQLRLSIIRIPAAMFDP